VVFVSGNADTRGREKLTDGMSATRKYRRLLRMITAPAAMVPVVGRRSVFAGHRGRKNPPSRAVMLYSCRACPSQPTMTAPTPIRSTDVARRAHRR
jgi:hypothetical protein